MIRLTALFPLACAITAFVLSMLCLFAGSKKGFMEEYHIVTLNTSTLGYNVLKPSTTSTASASQPTSLTSWITGEIQNITSIIEGDLTTIENDIANKLARELGIQEWYSLHMMDMCEGSYAPNATSKGAGFNTTECSNRTAMYHFNPTATINHELEVGGLNINISDIGWSNTIQGGINDLNAALDATFVLYCIGIGASGLAILTAPVSIFLESKLITFANLAIAFLAFLCLAIDSIIITVLEHQMVNDINKDGNKIGLYAYKGGKFLALTWSATALMLLASCTWVVEFWLRWRQVRREYTEKPLVGRTSQDTFDARGYPKM
ncbi:MAG: hypothetical protein M1818_000892 [Claussenomyces sp. TS43310]|nr:MAG: hypothetical protein M1818_000892 [Claussenomyces sp. TS43310]